MVLALEKPVPQKNWTKRRWDLWRHCAIYDDFVQVKATVDAKVGLSREMIFQSWICTCVNQMEITKIFFTKINF